MKTSSLFLAFSLLLLSPVIFSFEEKVTLDQTQVQAKTLATLNDIPWGMVSLDEKILLITLKKGKLATLDSTNAKVDIIDFPLAVEDSGQGGLLDVALSPDYQQSRLLYFTYAKKVPNGKTTALARGKWDQGKLIETKELFVASTDSNDGVHFGSRLAFDQAGHLFMTIGDRGKRERAQDLAFHNGKILRLNLDGSVPKDNPFVSTPGAKPEIWSYGHRNPQGIARSPINGELYASEHGPRGGDEINLILAGKNYGWPLVSYGKEYWGPSIGSGTEAPGIEKPIKYYVPSIAPCGLLIYSGKLFPRWKGDFFLASMVLTHLNHIDMPEQGPAVPIKEMRHFEKNGERLRHVFETPRGTLIFSTDSGKIVELSPLL